MRAGLVFGFWRFGVEMWHFTFGVWHFGAEMGHSSFEVRHSDTEMPHSTFEVSSVWGQVNRSRDLLAFFDWGLVNSRQGPCEGSLAVSLFMELPAAVSYVSWLAEQEMGSV